MKYFDNSWEKVSAVRMGYNLQNLRPNKLRSALRNFTQNGVVCFRTFPDLVPMSDLKAYFRCYICNISDIPSRECTKIFKQEEVLESGLRLSEAVEQILGHSINPSIDAVICTKCYKTCEEYDEINKRLMNIKSELRKTSENSSVNRAVIIKHEPTNQDAVHGQEDYILQTKSSQETAPETKPNPIIILSASKLKPVPSDFVLRNTVTSSLLKVGSPAQTAHFPVKLENSKVSSSATNTASLLIRNQQRKPTQASPSKIIQKIGTSNRTPVLRNAHLTNRKRVRVVTTPTVRTVKTSAHAANKCYLTLDQTSGPESDNYISEVEVLGSDHDQDGEAETILLDENGQVIEMIEDGTDIISEMNLMLPKHETKNENVEKVIEYEEEVIEYEEKPNYNLLNTDAEAKRIVSLNDNIYTCLVCKNAEVEDASAEECTFDEPSLVMVHMKDAHKLRLYVCTVCGNCYRKRANYDECVRSHHDSESAEMCGGVYRRRYVCDGCKRSFVSKTLLEQHMNMHTGSRPFKCKHCGKSYTNKYILHSHLKTHTNRPRPYKCKECGKSFLSLSNLSQHEKIHEPSKPNFLCRECGKTFMSAHSLETHAVVHSDERPFVCGVCEKAFARRAEVRDHLRTHTGEKPYACDVCGARFAQSSNMNSHKRAVHYDERRYECAQCPKKFRRRRLLKYHEQSAHTGERPHKCQVCDASFVYPEHLKKHKRALHDPNPKTFACEVCNKKFNSRDNRNAHRYTHSDKKPYECFVCGAGFMRKAHLYTHMSNEGHLADMIVVNQARLTLHGMKDREAEKAVASVQNNYVEIMVEDPSSSEATSIPMDMEQNAEEISVAMEQNIILPDPAANEDVEQFLAEGSEVLTTDEEGNVMRLVQVRLQDGRLVWATVATA